MASESAAFTSADYIQHHLTNLTYGKIDGVWQFAENAAAAKKMGFWAVNVDSMGWAVGLALVLVIELTRGAINKAVSSPPPLLLFHVTMSVFSLLFYVAMAVLGNGVRKGRADWQPLHRKFSWMFGVCRTANYVTSWMI